MADYFNDSTSDVLDEPSANCSNDSATLHSVECHVNTRRAQDVDWVSSLLAWQICPLMLLVFGSFGNVMTLVVLRGMTAARSTMPDYLKALAVSDLMLLYTGLLRHWLINVFGFDVRTVHVVACKLHLWLMHVTGMTSAWLLVSMTVERAMSVWWPHRVKFFCTKVKARFVIFIIVMMCGLISAHILFGLTLTTRTTGSVSQTKEMSTNTTTTVPRIFNKTNYYFRLENSFVSDSYPGKVSVKNNESVFVISDVTTLSFVTSAQENTTLLEESSLELSSSGDIHRPTANGNLSDTTNVNLLSVPDRKENELTISEQEELTEILSSCVLENNADYRVFFYETWFFLDLCITSLVPSVMVVVGNVFLLWRVVVSLQVPHSLNLGRRGDGGLQRRKTSSLTLTLLGASAVFLLTTSPVHLYLVLERLTAQMGSSGSYNVQQSSLNQSVWAVVNLLWYVNASSSLYLYCITGSKFRRRFLHILASLWSCLCARHRQPVTKTSSTLSSVDELVRSVLPQLRAPQQTINKEIQRTCNQRSSNGDSIVSTTVL